MKMIPRGQRVVVADGDRTVLELLQIRLDVAGYHACVARTGVAALETVRYVRPSALIIDIGLPEMDGFDVLRALAGRGEPPCPTLVVGRNLSLDNIKLARELGVRDCMAKPFSAADVLERLARMLRPAPDKPPKVHYIDEPQLRRA